MLQFEPAPAGVCRVPCSCGTRPENGVLRLTWLCNSTVIEGHQDIAATTPASAISTIRSFAKPPRRVRSYSSSGAVLRSSVQGHVLAAIVLDPVQILQIEMRLELVRGSCGSRSLNIVAFRPHMARESQTLAGSRDRDEPNPPTADSPDFDRSLAARKQIVRIAGQSSNPKAGHCAMIVSRARGS